MKTIVIRLAAGLILIGLWFTAGSQSPPALHPYAVQTHVHGSMSEGPGSMRGANIQAKKLGLDVLWWSDHDWRMA